MTLWPDTLVGRTVAVVLLGVLVSNVIGIGIFSDERSTLVSSNRGRLIAERVALAERLVEQTEPQNRKQVLRRLSRAPVRFAWSRKPWVTEDESDWRLRSDRSAIASELDLGSDQRLYLAVRTLGQMQQRFDLQLRRPHRRSDRGGPPDDLRPAPDGPRPPPDGPRPPPGGAPPDRRGPPPDLPLLVGSLSLTDGSWLNFGTVFVNVRPFWTTQFFIVVLVVMGIALAVSVWAVRRASRPLTVLAGAAERLGLDVDAPALSEQGPREVRAASRAFNTMQRRLQRFVHDRTQMLAAISHDLRTPITRMRLRAELVEDEDQRARMLVDLEEMEEMIAATLAFARDDPARERTQPLDLAALLQAVCDDAADAGGDAVYNGPTHLAFTGRVTALKRAFANLVDNALKYGHRARVSATANGRMITVAVDDDGPGVAEADRERVFEPFARVERSRSRETGGTGLGLAVVRAAIRAHGGDVTLANRPEGGLRATVMLPTFAS